MIEITNAQSAAIVTALHDGLALPLTRTDEIEEMRLKAYIEIVSDPMNAADTLALGEAIHTAIMLMRVDNMTIDPSALIEIHGSKMVRLAMSYAGVRSSLGEAKNVWSIGSPRQNGWVFTLPENILHDWLSLI